MRAAKRPLFTTTRCDPSYLSLGGALEVPILRSLPTPCSQTEVPRRTLAILPEILGDAAAFAALSSAFASRYYQSLFENSSMLVGRGCALVAYCFDAPSGPQPCVATAPLSHFTTQE